jgi:hypothetical protein
MTNANTPDDRAIAPAALAAWPVAASSSGAVSADMQHGIRLSGGEIVAIAALVERAREDAPRGHARPKAKRSPAVRRAAARRTAA